jgi:formylmethanofuran dehydrogenase subunit C
VAAIAQRPIPVGNQTAPLGEIFSISGNASDGVIRIEGELRNVSRIGMRLESGRIEIDGDAGHHIGAQMNGGEVIVRGSVANWAGAEMRGGLLSIQGNAGDWLGAAYPGSRLGMREGAILVSGRAGNDVGSGMRRGFIAVQGALGHTPARNMIAGSVFAFDSVGCWPGVGMKRGTLACFGAGVHDSTLGASFVPSGVDCPVFLAIYLQQLVEWGFDVPRSATKCRMARYNGDIAEGGQGEVLLAAH